MNNSSNTCLLSGNYLDGIIPHQFPLPSNVFPAVEQSKLITNAVKEAHLITQAPTPMVYLTAMTSVSLALQGLIDVEIPTGKVGPVSIMSMTIAGSGERKSTVDNLLTKGIKSFQNEFINDHKNDLEKYNIEMELHQRKTAKIKKTVNLEDEDDCKEMTKKLLSHQEHLPVKPLLSMVKSEDSTLEALLNDLNNNIPNAFFGSSEGGVLLNSKVMSQTAALNSIWSGDDITVNRKTEGSFTIEGARLTSHIMTQPSALQRFFNKNKDDVRGNGFLSRFLICAPTSNCGFRNNNGLKYSDDGLSEFNNRVAQLLKDSSVLDDYKNRRIISFSDGAKKIWLEVYNDIEKKMGPDGLFSNAKDHASKLPENIARLAALIHCFENSFDEEISSAVLFESINLMGYFSGHFMEVFCQPPKYLIDAQNLTAWLNTYLNAGVRYIKKNSILQYGPIGTRKKRDLDLAFEHAKPLHGVVFIKVKRTWVLDLSPQFQFNQAKLNEDLALDAIY